MESTTIVFAVTPRAGRWNHRYLVPVSAHWSEGDLVQWSDQAGRRTGGERCLTVSRDVRQSSTGRTGTERVILCDPRLSALRDHPRTARAVREKLQACLEQMDTLVTEQIDWTETGERLVIQHPCLNQWQRELDDELAPLPSEPQGTRSPGNGVAIATRVTITVALIIALGMTAWGLTGGLFRKTQTELFHQQVHELATRLGIPTMGHDEIRIIEQVTEKLETDLFAREGDSLEGEERLLHTLRQFQEAVFDKPDPTARLLEDQGIVERLEALYPPPEHEFQKCGLLRAELRKSNVGNSDDDQLVDDLEAIDPRRFRDIIQALANLKSSLKGARALRSPDSGDAYVKFFRAVDRADWPNGPASDSQPMFYLPADLRSARELRSVLEHGSLWPSSEPVPPTLLQKFVALSRRKANERFSIPIVAHEIGRYDEHGPEHQVFTKLKNFLKACDKARPLADEP